MEKLDILSLIRQKMKFFLYHKLQNISFCGHLSAVEVVETSSLYFIPQNSLVHYATCVMKTMSNNKCYVLYNY